jgi:hypothetical protein
MEEFNFLSLEASDELIVKILDSILINQTEWTIWIFKHQIIVQMEKN